MPNCSYNGIIVEGDPVLIHRVVTELKQSLFAAQVPILDPAWKDLWKLAVEGNLPDLLPPGFSDWRKQHWGLAPGLTGAKESIEEMDQPEALRSWFAARFGGFPEMPQPGSKVIALSFKTAWTPPAALVESVINQFDGQLSIAVCSLDPYDGYTTISRKWQESDRPLSPNGVAVTYTSYDTNWLYQVAIRHYGFDNQRFNWSPDFVLESGAELLNAIQIEESTLALVESQLQTALYIGTSELNGNTASIQARRGTDNIRERLNRYHIYEREQITGEASGGSVITRAEAGFEVLNTPQLMFVDVDFELFLPAMKPVPPIEDQTAALLGKVSAWVADKPDEQWNIRVYRTGAGCRLMVTHRAFDVADATFDALCVAVGADELFRELCHIQQCFRARLTPKPIRCMLGSGHPSCPFINDFEEEQFDNWLKRYTIAADQYATCHLVKSIGSGYIHPELQILVDLHDNCCQVHSGKLLETPALNEVQLPDFLTGDWDDDLDALTLDSDGCAVSDIVCLGQSGPSQNHG